MPNASLEAVAEGQAQLGRPPVTSGTIRALGVSPAYWFCMLAASALGTNLGDFTVDELSAGRGTSFVVLAALAGLGISIDRRQAARTEAGYWLAIVTLRAAATNVGDFLTHDLGISYPALTMLFGVLTLIAAYATRTAERRGTPRIDAAYWGVMALAGIFGTIGGDLASHNLGLGSAAILLGAIAVALITWRSRFAPFSVLAYWCVVLAERCAGTPVGDALASRHAVGLGLSMAMLVTGGLLATGLLARGQERRRPQAAG